MRVLDVAPRPADASLPWWQGSILDPEVLEDAMAGVGAVVHCAAIAQLWTRRRASYDEVNVEGVRRVVEHASRRSLRIVHVSSYTTLVGSRSPAGAVLDERSELPPAALCGPYPRSKREGERVALAAAEEGADIVIVMPTAPIGAGGDALTPPMVLVRDVARGTLPALLDAPINIVPASSLAAGIVAARDRGGRGRRYLLAGQDLPLTGFAAAVARLAGVAGPRLRVPGGVALAAAHVEEMLARFTGRPPRASLTGVRLALRRHRFDGSRARRELGYEPGPLEPAIREALAWLRAQGHLPHPPR